MDGQSITIIVAVTMVVIVVGAIVAFIFRQKRKEQREREFSQIATTNGLEFVSEGNSYVGRFDDGQKPFRMVGGGRAHNILSGTYRGRPICAFEYS